ncbi:MAG: PSD1 domain-containing protein, partial [Planctomycetaceae bacterium]|nr:PSD1 domain-containing protein [Planctomycetaceae bacterium]
MPRTSLTALLSLFTLLSAPGKAQAEPVDFVRDIRPIFLKHCDSCHGAEKQKSGLRLDIKSEAFKGGELYGPSLVAGKPDESPLWQFVADKDADLVMPPEGDGLSPAEIATLTRWISEGAKWPDGVDLATLEDRRDHWSFHPVNHVSPPSVKDSAWPRNAIDQFILARLENKGLKPAEETSRVAWLRRVSFDLIGLPPTPDQVSAFVNDESELAYDRVVDELLQSPRYGERWAQHWLDVVRYADTHGFEVNTERPNAWPYRDYVIRALNADVPYDQFIREQLAGDAYGEDAATGFLVTASVLLPGQIGKDAPSIRLARQDSLDEIVINISQTFLGLSIGCARCHDHKFDPVSQREYYAMQSFVAGVEYGDRDLRGPDVEQREQQAAQLKQQLAALDGQQAVFVPLAGSGVTRPMINARDNIDRFAPVSTKKLRFTILATNSLEPCVDELEIFNGRSENIALASTGAVVRSSGDRTEPNRHELRLVNNGHYGNSSSWMSSEHGAGWLEVEFPEEQQVERVRWGRDREGKYIDRLAIDYRIEVEGPEGNWIQVADASDRQPYDPEVKDASSFTTEGLDEEQVKVVNALLAQRTQLVQELKTVETPPQVFAGRFRTPDEIHLLLRGDPEQPKDRVAPTVPEVLGALELPMDAPEQERRRALADWIANPENPLTARVMVNRIWQSHFGIGLVETSSDFGRSGMQPSHPDLLDWLATEFIRSGWSLKHMHKLMVLSSTY